MVCCGFDMYLYFWVKLAWAGRVSKKNDTYATESSRSEPISNELLITVYSPLKTPGMICGNSVNAFTQSHFQAEQRGKSHFHATQILLSDPHAMVQWETLQTGCQRHSCPDHRQELR